MNGLSCKDQAKKESGQPFVQVFLPFCHNAYSSSVDTAIQTGWRLSQATDGTESQNDMDLFIEGTCLECMKMQKLCIEALRSFTSAPRHPLFGWEGGPKQKATIK